MRKPGRGEASRWSAARTYREPDVGDILAKISRHEPDSLARAERDRLEAARPAKLRRRS